MANELRSGTEGAQMQFAEWLDNKIGREVRPQNVHRPHFAFHGRENSDVFQWTINADPGAGAAVSAATDQTNATASGFTPTAVTASAGTIGQMTTVLDELNAVSVVDAFANFGAVLVRSILEKYETDFAALADDSFSNSTSTSGIDLTGDTFFAAHAALLARDVFGTEISVLDPVQSTDLQRDVQSSTASMYGNDSVDINGIAAASLAGYQFTYLGIPVYQTSLQGTANSGADNVGSIYISGEALGLYEIWGPRTEMQRDASMMGTEIVASARYGVVEIRDTFGQAIVTDA
jgi:hypothetical protein